MPGRALPEEVPLHLEEPRRLPAHALLRQAVEKPLRRVRTLPGHHWSLRSGWHIHRYALIKQYLPDFVKTKQFSLVMNDKTINQTFYGRLKKTRGVSGKTQAQFSKNILKQICYKTQEFAK